MSAIVAAAGTARLHVPVVRPAPAPEARDARGAGDGRAGPAGLGRGLAALVHGLALADAEPEATSGAAARGADGVLLPRRPRRARRHALARRRAAALRELAAAAIERARPYARELGAEAARRRSSASCRRQRRRPHARGPRARRDARVLAHLVDESAEPLEVPMAILAQLSDLHLHAGGDDRGAAHALRNAVAAVRELRPRPGRGARERRPRRPRRRGRVRAGPRAARPAGDARVRAGRQPRRPRGA